MSNIYEKLQQIQLKLKAPKNQFNKFGGYKYRNCEDILEAVKPLLKETSTTLTLEDEMIEVAGRVYVKAIATLFDLESSEKICVKANAREEETKKGMDGSQITGASSSYARKYALNGLFAIDDTKDNDTLNEDEKPQKTVTTADRDLLAKILEENGLLEKTLDWAGKNGWGSISEIPDDVVIQLIKKSEAQ